MPLKIDGSYRCSWVRENNGVIQSLWTPANGAPAHDRIITFNTPREDGVPELGDFLSLTGKSGQKQE